MTQTTLPTVGTPASLATFEALTKGAPAPHWLHAGVTDSWALDLARTEVTLITVSENATFLVRVDGRPSCVVRVSQPGYVAGTDAIESELAWMRALAEIEGVTVSTSIPTAAGPYVATIADEAGNGWYCVAFDHIDGEVLEDLTDPAPYYREIGRMTAHFHEHAQSWQAPSGFSRFTWDVADMIGPTCRWGRWEDATLTPVEHVLLDRAQNAALALLEGRSRDRASHGLIHADLRPSNIMVSGDELTIIDFDDSGYGWFHYDFAAALSFLEHEAYAPRMAQEWIEGYRAVRRYSGQDELTGCALSMLRRLTMLGWTTNHRADALPDGLFAAQTWGTCDVAERFLRSATWLLD